MGFTWRLFVMPMFILGMAAFIWYKLWRCFGALWANLWAAFSFTVVIWSMASRFVFFETPAPLAIIGYMFLPFTGFAFILLVIIDLVDLLLKRAISRRFSQRKVMSAVLISVVVFLCYGYLEAKDIIIREITIPTDKLPDNIQRIRVVQLTDLHIGKTFGESRLANAMQLAESVSPDVLVLTGDIVDADLDGRNDLADILGSVNPPLGKFAVTGNHEHYSGLEQAIKFIKSAGYDLLRSGWKDLGPIIISGVDDQGVVFSNSDSALEMLGEINDGKKFRLLLKHQPFVDENSIGKFDLQLSGHTHGGQIWPFRYVSRLTHGHRQGLVNLVSGDAQSLLYVSNGTGYWGPPIRFLTPPEITVFNIVQKNQLKDE